MWGGQGGTVDSEKLRVRIQLSLELAILVHLRLMPLGALPDPLASQSQSQQFAEIRRIQSHSCRLVRSRYSISADSVSTSARRRVRRPAARCSIAKGVNRERHAPDLTSQNVFWIASPCSQPCPCRPRHLPRRRYGGCTAGHCRWHNGTRMTASAAFSRSQLF